MWRASHRCHVQFYFKTVCYPQHAMPRGTIVLQLLIGQQTYVRLANILTEILSCKSIAYRRLTLELPHHSCTNKYQIFQRMFFLKTCTEIKFYFSICINKVKIEMSKRSRRERRLLNCNCCCDELLFSQWKCFPLLLIWGKCNEHALWAIGVTHGVSITYCAFKLNIDDEHKRLVVIVHLRVRVRGLR